MAEYKAHPLQPLCIRRFPRGMFDLIGWIFVFFFGAYCASCMDISCPLIYMSNITQVRLTSLFYGIFLFIYYHAAYIVLGPLLLIKLFAFSFSFSLFSKYYLFFDLFRFFFVDFALIPAWFVLWHRSVIHCNFCSIRLRYVVYLLLYTFFIIYFDLKYIIPVIE